MFARIYRMLSKIAVFAKHFGIITAFKLCVISRKKGSDYKHKVIISYLLNRYKYLVDEYKGKKGPSGILRDDAPIWVFWYQGLDSAPLIVKSCISSIERHCGVHPLILLTKDNFKQYISIPQYIMDKVACGSICLAHFSDILRSYLIAEHGGIWLDATIYLTADLGKEWNTTFYSLKQVKPDANTHISEYMWAGFCFGGVKNNLLSCFLRDFLTEYNAKENFYIDYFLMDYIYRIGYDNITEIKQLIDNIPYSSPDLFYMGGHLADPYDAESLAEVMKTTHIFKLTYHKVKVTNPEGTLYEKIIEGGI